MSLTALLMVVLGASAPGTAGPAMQNLPAAPDARSKEEITVVGEKFKENRRVCKTTTPTGSIMQKKICKTVAQWDQEKMAGRRAVDQMLQQQAVQQNIIARCMRDPGGLPPGVC